MSIMRQLANMAEGTSPEEAASRVFREFMIQRTITCPVTGRLLDIRKAVLIELQTESGDNVESIVLADQSVADEWIPKFEKRLEDFAPKTKLVVTGP